MAATHWPSGGPTSNATVMNDVPWLKREPTKSRTPRQRKAKAKRASKTHGKSK